MEEHIKNAMRFYLLATKLKYKIRSGWDKNHWNVDSERIESIAEHIYGTLMLAVSICSNTNQDVDLNKVALMLALHEMEEIVIGDIAFFDTEKQKNKKQDGKQAVENIFKDCVNKQEFLR